MSIVYPAQTYWNGEPTPARIVRVIVGPSPRPSWWCADLEGTEREAVEVNYPGSPPFYLDNEGDNSGWNKVTFGRGSPVYGHRSLPVARVLPSALSPPPPQNKASRMKNKVR